MRARVPNFVKSKKMNKIADNNSNYTSNYISSKELNKLMKEQQEQQRFMTPTAVVPLSNFQQIRGKSNRYQPNFSANDHQQQLWHAKSHESGISKKIF